MVEPIISVVPLNRIQQKNPAASASILCRPLTRPQQKMQATISRTMLQAEHIRHFDSNCVMLRSASSELSNMSCSSCYRGGIHRVSAEIYGAAHRRPFCVLLVF